MNSEQKNELRFISFYRKSSDWNRRGGKRWTKCRIHKTRELAERRTNHLQAKGYETKIEQASW